MSLKSYQEPPAKYIEQGDSFMDRVGKMIFNFIHGYDNELLWL